MASRVPLPHGLKNFGAQAIVFSEVAEEHSWHQNSIPSGGANLRVPVVRIDSHRFENNFMNREVVRSGSVPLRFVSRPVHGFIRFHSVRFLSGIDCVIAFNKGSVCGNVYSSIQTISVGVRNFLKATLALKIA